MFSSIIAAIAGWSLLRDFQNKVEGLPYNIQGRRDLPISLFLSQTTASALHSGPQPNQTPSSPDTDSAVRHLPAFAQAVLSA